jgi:aflatoxin B1 aldehyde reductase
LGIILSFDPANNYSVGTEQARIFDLEKCARVLDVFQEFGHNEIDTARIYGDGSSEEWLGRLHWKDRGLIVATKLSPVKRFPILAAGLNTKTYTHEPEELRPALLDSLETLKTDKVRLSDSCIGKLLSNC